jgi:UDP-glucose 4-epimerase
VENSEVLLVGGAGFLGTRLAKSFLDVGWDVAILDRFPCKELEGRIVQFTGELRDTHFVRSVLGRYPRNILYLAHETRTAPAADRVPANFLGNIETFTAFLDEAADCGAESISLFSSGGAVYGEPETLPIPESHPTNPKSLYGIAKLTMEKCLRMTADLRGFRHLCLRPSNPYGPGQNFNGSQGLVAVAMAKIARGEPLTIYGDGSATKDYLFADDLANAVRLLLHDEHASGCFNIGSGNGITSTHLIQMIESVVGRKAGVEHVSTLPGDVSANVLDVSRLKSATGWQPHVSIEDGLVQTWDWIRPRF